MRIRAFCAYMLFFSTVTSYAAGVRLWPSETCEARAHQDSSLVIRPEKSLDVRTGTGYDWPGVTVFFKEGSRDLMKYGGVIVTLSNSCHRPLNICLSVKNRPDKGSSPGGQITLAPGTTGRLNASMAAKPWLLDAPLELVGMRGYPSSTAGGQFDIRKTAEFHVFLNRPDREASFTLIGIDLTEAEQQPKILDAETFLPFVDRFGQFRHDDWPGKIHAEEELKRDAAAERKYLAEAQAPASFNKWGGWAEGPLLKATGHFRTEKVGGIWWLVDPDGRLFFSHGIDCVQPGTYTGIQYRESYFDWLPEENSPFSGFYGWNSWAPHGFYKDKGNHRTYSFSKANMLRKYGDNWLEVYRDMAHRRIRAWGLNTIANWSDAEVFQMRRTPYVVNLGTKAPPIEGSDGWWGKFPDPFHPDFRLSIRKSLERRSETAADPWCIGYFVDNELSWGKTDTALAEAALKSPAVQPSKIAIRDWLLKKYGGIDQINRAWRSDFATSDDLLAGHYVPENPEAATDLAKLHELIASQYFSVIRDELRKGAPGKLYLGCRFAAGSPASYRVSSHYCDVVSFNNYRRTVEKDLPENSTDKPLINGEFHFGALDRGLFHTGLVPVRDQQERAEAYTEFVVSCLKHPRYVGTHWFQWRDQPLTGRGDGENYQIGFLTETDRPYPEMIAASRRIAETMYQIRMENCR